MLMDHDTITASPSSHCIGSQNLVNNPLPFVRICISLGVYTGCTYYCFYRHGRLALDLASLLRNIPGLGHQSGGKLCIILSYCLWQTNMVEIHVNS